MLKWWDNLSFSKKFVLSLLSVVWFVLSFVGIFYYIQENYLKEMLKNLSLIENKLEIIENLKSDYLKWKFEILKAILNKNCSFIKNENILKSMHSLSETASEQKVKELVKKGIQIIEDINKSLKSFCSEDNLDSTFLTTKIQSASKQLLNEVFDNLIIFLKNQKKQVLAKYKKKKLISQILYCVCLIPLFFIILIYAKAIEKTFSKVIREIEVITKKIMQGDFTYRAKITRGDELGKILENLNRISENITQHMFSVVNALKDQIGNVYQFTENFAVFNEKVSGQIKKVTSNAISISEKIANINEEIENSANAASQIMEAVEEIGKNTQNASEMAKDAATKADFTNQVMKNLSNLAEEISGVIDLISDIAEQTKFLALNASIEAARAGAAGKGFAVVAEEVKNLAKRVSDAALEVSAKVEKIVEETQNAVVSTEEIVTIIHKLEEVNSLIASAVEKVA